MTIWTALTLCVGNVASSLAGMAALKQAVETNNVLWALAAVGCWVGTAMFIASLMAHQPIIWIALVSSCLSILGSVAIGMAFGESASTAQIAAVVLIVAALALTSSTG